MLLQFLFASPMTIKVQGENFCKVQLLGIFIEIALYVSIIIFIHLFFIILPFKFNM